MLSASFFFLRIALVVWGLLWFHINLGLFVLFLWKMLLEFWFGQRWICRWLWVVWIVCVSCSVVSLFDIPWTIACEALPSVEFSRQEYCSGLSFLPPGDLPNPRIEPESPALQADSSLLHHLGSPYHNHINSSDPWAQVILLFVCVFSFSHQCLVIFSV